MRYGVPGWKDRYYASKLGLPRGDPTARAVVVGHYVKGLCWVLMYYYQGVQDWGWYYPYHYAPCASDLVDLAAFAGGRYASDVCTRSSRVHEELIMEAMIRYIHDVLIMSADLLCAHYARRFIMCSL